MIHDFNRLEAKPQGPRRRRHSQRSGGGKAGAAKEAKALGRRECFECIFKPEPKGEEAPY